MVEKKVIFWDVDTQFDFMNPQGKLYVPDAEKMIDAVSETRRFALQNGYSIVASVDWHSLDDEEISLTPDHETTFPPHCMAFEAGSERVGYLGEIPIESIPIESIETEMMGDAELTKRLDRKQFHLVIRTNSVDVFKNPNTAALLNLIRPQMVVVFGVALDVCVYYTVSGLLRRGQADIIVLKDAVKGLATRARVPAERRQVESA
ncbi:MAG: cysteine hydrolase family protein [Planctomycetota bacterium]|jgi:nicotinamidase/pyrazinamidase